MSHYTFTLLPEVYRWIVADQILPNLGQLNEKGLVAMPTQSNKKLENGWVVAQAIKCILAKTGQPPSPHLTSISVEETKAARVTNWNFIWLCFEDLRIQFDQRIRDLIIQGEYALIPEILKQLYQRDENKNEKQMKTIIINQKPLPVDSKGKTQTKNNTLDVKRINLQKEPSQSQSSLEFLILLLASSFSMPVEEILGLFTNQNKYLAHLLVKGINQNFDGVVLFYTLLLKNKEKFKEYIENDHRDAESLLYAVKPGLISKSVKVAELSLDLFQGLPKVYEWFISDTGRGSSTLGLGVKRHPYMADKYCDLLLEIIRNEEENYFTKHFMSSFRDPVEMIEICTYLLPPIAQSFLKTQLLELEVFQEWTSLAISLFQEDLACKIIGFKYIGALMSHIPELVDQNEDYLIGIRRGWRQYSMVEFSMLFEQILLMLEEMAAEKRPMARRVFQIIIEIMENVFTNEEKREYLVRGFTTLISNFPKIPAHHLISCYKEGSLTSADFQMVLTALQNAPDLNSAIRIAEIMLKLFNSHAVLNSFLGPLIYKICRRGVHEDPGRILIMKVLRECLSQYVHLEGIKKVPEVAKKQPMYFVQKGNEKYNAQEEQEYIVMDKCSKNILQLMDKIIDLILSMKSETLSLAAKQQLLQSNAIVKKNQYKANSKALSNLLAKKFGVTRQEQENFNEDYKVKKSLIVLEESMAKRRMASSSAAAASMSNSRYAAPEHIKKEFDEVIEKRKKEENDRKLEEQRKQRDEALKKLMVKKQLEKTNLLRGFGQEAELKEQGFWSKLMGKQELQLYPKELMEGRDLQYIDNLFKKYHKVLRNLFFKYTSSKYTIKSHANVNFEDNKERNETLNIVEIIQFLKDYKLFFLTSKDEVQSLVRDLNVKLLNKRQTQELDFAGFEQFVIQFCVLIYTKTHTINANTNRGIQAIKKNFGHLSHLQLVEEWFNYLKLVFIQKGEKTSLFDQPEAAYFNQTEVVKEFAKKLEEDPTFILPEGYKKVTEKNLKLTAKLSDKYTKISEAYRDVYEILDQILFQSDLRLHLLEPLVEKQTKVRVKPHAFLNVKAKLMEAGETKVRALSSIIDKKPAIPPVKMLERKNLSFGMKLGLSYVSYKDKLLGEQVAYVLDDMLLAVQAGKSSIAKEKVINDVQKKRQEMYQKQKFLEIQREKKRLERKNQIEKIKKQTQLKKEKELQDTKEERERKKQRQLSREKKKKEDQEKYLAEQKKKLDQKKQKDQEQQKKKKDDKKKQRQDRKKKETQFKDFNNKQIEKFKKEFNEESEKKKKEQERGQEQRKKKEELVRKLRTRIHDKDKKAIEEKQKMIEEINELYHSDPIRMVFAQFQPSIRAVFDFLLKSSFLPVTLKKNNSEIIFETWHYFALVFQLSPLIIHAKQLTKIFRFFTKDKQNHKDYTIGLTYEEFKQGILRITIKHKSIFNKLAEKIKENMTSGQIDAVVQKDIEEKQKNQFEEPKQIDVRNLVKEEDINTKITDHYGDISKVTERTLKGLIYYLKVPKDKQGQDKRFREILASKISYSASNFEKLRQKLNDEYSLAPPPPKKKMEKSQLMNQSMEGKQETPPPEA